MSRSTKFLSLASCAAGALLLLPTLAEAQASISARATVSQVLAVNAGANLEFGQVVPGFTKTVDVTDGTAGTFSLGGAPNAEVSVTFSSLPDNLSDGINVLPITYTGVHNKVDDPITGAAAFLPGSGATTPLSNSGELFVFLGGTVDATAGTPPPPGLYTGTITLTGAYTGN